MDCKYIEEYCRRYENDPRNEKDVEIEKRLGKEIKKQRKLTIDDLVEITEWKFEGSPWKTRRTADVKKNPSELVEKITEEALKLKEDEVKIRLLECLTGVGTAMASTILAFYDPENYGIVDEHVWDELFNEKGKRDFEIEEYLKVQEEFRKDKEKYPSLRIRDIEKAYYQKNIERRTN